MSHFYLKEEREDFTENRQRGSSDSLTSTREFYAPAVTRYSLEEISSLLHETYKKQM